MNEYIDILETYPSLGIPLIDQAIKQSSEGSSDNNSNTTEDVSDTPIAIQDTDNTDNMSSNDNLPSTSTPIQALIDSMQTSTHESAKKGDGEQGKKGTYIQGEILIFPTAGDKSDNTNDDTSQVPQFYEPQDKSTVKLIDTSTSMDTSSEAKTTGNSSQSKIQQAFDEGYRRGMALGRDPVGSAKSMDNRSESTVHSENDSSTVSDICSEDYKRQREDPFYTEISEFKVDDSNQENSNTEKKDDHSKHDYDNNLTTGLDIDGTDDSIDNNSTESSDTEMENSVVDSVDTNVMSHKVKNTDNNVTNKLNDDMKTDLNKKLDNSVPSPSINETVEDTDVPKNRPSTTNPRVESGAGLQKCRRRDHTLFTTRNYHQIETLRTLNHIIRSKSDKSQRVNPRSTTKSTTNSSMLTIPTVYDQSTMTEINSSPDTLNLSGSSSLRFSSQRSMAGVGTTIKYTDIYHPSLSSSSVVSPIVPRTKSTRSESINTEKTIRNVPKIHMTKRNVPKKSVSKRTLSTKILSKKNISKIHASQKNMLQKNMSKIHVKGLTKGCRILVVLRDHHTRLDTTIVVPRSSISKFTIIQKV